MTKAQRIFLDTERACKKNLKDWGIERNPDGRVIGFTSLEGDCTFCARTFNAVQDEIDKAEKHLNISIKYLDLSAEEIEFRRAVIEMVQVTLDNHKRRYAEIMA